MRVLRWGRSAYETEASLALEAQGVRALGAHWSHEADASRPPSHQADVLVVNSGVHVTRAVLEQVGCGLVLTTTSGTDHIDKEACRTKKVVMARCPIARRDAVVEHAFASMIWLRRRLPHIQSTAENGIWGRSALPALQPKGITGANVAVVGLGVIGTMMVRRLLEWGANVYGVDPNPIGWDLPTYSLDEALRHADIVTLHCALNAENQQMLNDDRLAMLHENAIVVNTARGPLLDVAAAAKRIEQGQLGGMAVDVFPVEPYPNLEQLKHPSILLSPHASGYRSNLAELVCTEVVATLGAWANGTPLPHLVRG